jgi:hypothetical protein
MSKKELNNLRFKDKKVLGGAIRRFKEKMMKRENACMDQVSVIASLVWPTLVVFVAFLLFLV